MTNKIKGCFDFEVDGENYSLQFTTNGMCELEAAAGRSTTKFLRGLEDAAKNDDLSFGDVRLLFWAGLQEHQPGITVQEAGKLIQGMGGIVPAMELAGEAVEASMPEPEGGGDPSAGKKKAGTS